MMPFCRNAYISSVISVGAENCCVGADIVRNGKYIVYATDVKIHIIIDNARRISCFICVFLKVDDLWRINVNAIQVGAICKAKSSTQCNLITIW